MRFARLVAETVSGGAHVPDAVNAALGRVKTGLFRQQAVKRAEFRDAIVDRFSDPILTTGEIGLTSVLIDFAKYAEGQLARPFKKDPGE